MDSVIVVFPGRVPIELLFTRKTKDDCFQENRRLRRGAGLLLKTREQPPGGVLLKICP